MPLRIGEDAEGHARHLLGRLEDRPAELHGPRERRLDVLDADEEEDRILAALQRADRLGIAPSAPVSTNV